MGLVSAIRWGVFERKVQISELDFLAAKLKRLERKLGLK
jgi:hypothetical protein